MNMLEQSDKKEEELKLWRSRSRILPHALSAIQHAQNLKIASEVTWCLYNLVDNFLENKAHLEESNLLSKSWQDLLILAKEGDCYDRYNAARALGDAFTHVPDTNKAWQDLINLSQERNCFVKYGSTRSLGEAIKYVPDKDNAWRDLIKLVEQEDSPASYGAIGSLGMAFINVQDKKQAWKDLLSLIQLGDNFTRYGAAKALGEAYPYYREKNDAWLDLISLTHEDDPFIRMYAYYSLARASVLKATESDNIDILKTEIEKALTYFEMASKETPQYNPAKFCLPFYRSYFLITFQNATDREVQKYLEEANAAVEGSKSKQELLNAVENLAKALQETEKLTHKTVQELASELNAYRWYCDQAAEHLNIAEMDAPGAAKLLRKCNPLLEKKIFSSVNEIQNKANAILKIASEADSEYMPLCTKIKLAADNLSIENIVEVPKSINQIIISLDKFCKLLPKKKIGSLSNVINKITRSSELPEKLLNIEIALSYLTPILRERLAPFVDVVILTVLPMEYNEICSRLSDPHSPPNMGSIPNLCAWRFGDVMSPKLNRKYGVAVGMIGRAGINQSVLATREAIDLWRPRYIIFAGIAGGLPDSGLRKGDVIIAESIFSYEYGKIDNKFTPRGNWTFRTDRGLLNGAIAYALQDNWHDHIVKVPPEECKPKVISGEIASGEKIVDDPTNKFFLQVIKAWPKAKAVEMEGSGVANAIEQANSLGHSTGFIMVRGISDLARQTKREKSKVPKERDKWRDYAAETAAAFIVGWIADGLPLEPSLLK